MKHRYSISKAIKIWIYILGIIYIFLLLMLLFISVNEHKYYVFLAVGAAGAVLAAYTGYFLVYRRNKKIEKICQLYIEGYITEEEYEKNVMISDMIDAVYKCQSEKLDKTKILNLSKKQAQYLALQNQINPHFLYNTLEGIRSEALCSDMDRVANMAEALATFFRYTISNIDKMVTLEDELANVENYYIIQKYRFGEKLQLKIEYGDDLSVLSFKLPKLILQPIVENAVYHGIENKLGQGTLKIQVNYTAKRLLIKISDDGMGIEKETLEELNTKLLTNSLEDITESKQKKGGIAILNVNNRIKLLYGEEYGIFIQSLRNVGTDVQIVLPVIKE
ncbi:MAG: histidine kinase [Ruminococcus sp.]|jgi:two-component system sensor histidine kinase YesM|nr:histidine kinase [Ruminococcus sp.]